jgi:putative tricarboxylic transport membrane protein
MGLIDSIILGFSTALHPANLVYCFIGVILGTLVGVLPGIGPTGAIAILLPSTFHVTPEGALIMLAGIYYGSAYGGSTTSILVNIPGEACSVVTCLDGYQMARQGRAGPALGIAAFGSFIAGTFGIIGLMLIGPQMARLALKFGPPEYFSLVCLALTLLTLLSPGSVAKSLTMACMGIMLGCIGIDPISGVGRYTFGIPNLMDGIGIIPLCMGLFGIGEVLLNLESTGVQKVFESRIQNLLPNRKDWSESIPAILRGTGIGFLVGILPGGGAVLSSFISYAVEKKVSKHRERFGHGAIEGVAGPESANNAASQSAFIPLFSLGIPSNATTAVLLGALIVHGVQTGPMLIAKHPALFWGVVASMYIGNALLVVLNLPLIGMWVKVLKIPYRILFPLIVLFTLIGAYSINGSAGDLVITIVFGFVGYLMKKFDYQPAPLILAYILTTFLEQSLRQSLLISDGSFRIFFDRPLSAAILIMAAVVLILPLIKRRTWAAESSQED